MKFNRAILSLLGVGVSLALTSTVAKAEICPMANDGDYVLDPWSTNASYANGAAVQSDGKIVIAGYAANGVNCSVNSCMAIARYDASGCRDISFGTGGLFTHALGGNLVHGDSMSMQPDGKFLVGGYSSQVISGAVYNALMISRVTTSGGLDAAFNGSGYNLLALSGRDNSAMAIGMQTQGANAGKIIAAGFSWLKSGTSSSSTDSLIARFNASGTLDTGKSGFGTGGGSKVGYTITNAKSSSLDRIEAIAIQGDDKIVAAGYWSNSAGAQAILLERHLANGGLDSTFGSSGIVLPNLGGSLVHTIAYGAALQADGKIVIVGESDEGGVTGNDSVIVARFNSNGSLDTAGFNAPKGYLLIDADPTSIEKAEAVTLQPADGKIVVAAHSIPLTIAIRLNTDGTLDSSFGSGGIKTKASAISGEVLWPSAVALQSNGDLIFAGTRNTGTGASSQPFFMQFFP